MGIAVRHHAIPRETIEMVSRRYKTITQAVNASLWGTSSDSAHSIYVGSYGRGTAVGTSDIDMLVEVPLSYQVFHSPYSTYNPQSRLLQVVRRAVLARFPRSNVRADGQVVVVDFSDGVRFEVLPALKQRDGRGGICYKYPDSHMGGNWMSTDPRAEQDAMTEMDHSSNGLLKDTCKHIRTIRDESYKSYHLSGIVIDSFVCDVIGSWKYANDGEAPAEAGAYERALLDAFNYKSSYGSHAFDLRAPGSRMQVSTQTSIDCLGKVLRAMV